MSSAAAAKYVIVISVDGLGGTYLAKMFDGTATGGPYAIPNFTRLKNEGTGTLAAHCDNATYDTLPNHTSIITGRPMMSVGGLDGHNWTINGDPAVGQTIHSNKGLPGPPVYVVGVFDVAHDNGLRTGMYANKSKFSLFDNTADYPGGGSYNATYGAPDITGPDNGRDKIDNLYINTALGGIVVNTFIAQQIDPATRNQYAFLHINESDSYGHSKSWGSATWYSSVVAVDTMLGRIFKLIGQDVPAMTGKTAIILTADHGNQDNPPTGADRYQVPFFVWGPGVPAGADLYTLNSSIRQKAASYPMTTYGGMQPMRNAEANNVALYLLGLEAIPGSTFNYAQNLVVTQPSVTLGLAGSPLAEAGGVATVTATLSVPYTLPVTVNLLFSGTAAVAADYTRSGTSIAIPAGSGSGSLTLTAVADAVYESPDKTIVVDIGTVVNATEDGIQQVTATITDDDPDYVPWMAGYYAPPGDPKAQPGADPDHDGMTNQQEYAFGLDPSSGSSANPIKEPLDKTTGRFTYSRRKPALTRLPYIYQYSTTLSGTWNPFIPVGITSDNGDPVEMLTVEVPAALLANPLLFVRVKAE